MDFGLSEQQALLQETFRGFLAEHAPIARVREWLEGGECPLWADLAKLGAAGVLVPEQYGGSGLALFDAGLIALELGRAAAPTPFLASAVLAPTAFTRAGSPEQQREWLPRLATGDARVGVAVTEIYSRREGAGVHAREDRLSGKALFAIDVAGVAAFLIASSDLQLWLVDAEAEGLTLEPLRTIDRTRDVGELVLDGARGERLPGGDPETLAAILDAGRIALTGDTLGACDAMLERSVAYAQERRQFGRAIGSFQAVKHLCAEMVAEIEPARSLFWYAAHALGTGLAEGPALAAHAKSHAAQIARDVATTATEVHGGVGFTDEQNLHFWFKRIGLNRQLLGAPEILRERAALLEGL